LSGIGFRKDSNSYCLHDVCKRSARTNTTECTRGAPAIYKYLKLTYFICLGYRTFEQQTKWLTGAGLDIPNVFIWLQGKAPSFLASATNATRCGLISLIMSYGTGTKQNLTEEALKICVVLYQRAFFVFLAEMGLS